jgi:hypothetical protein
MLGAMRLRSVLVALVTCAALAGCGGSSQPSSTQATATPAASAQTATSTQAAATAATPTGATTTTTSTSAPPEVPKAKRHAHHRGTGAASQGAHVETNMTIGANGDVSPAAVSVPSGVGVELHVTNHGSAPDTVALSVPSHPSVKVAPGASATLHSAGLKGGTYRILVNGTPRGQLVIGAQGGP